MKVPYNYLPMQFSQIEEIISEWRQLISSTEFTLGPYVEKFENEFAEFIGSKFVISTNNGTDALILSLKACGIGPGDEVISVSTTFYATIGAIVAVGAKPVFVDIDDAYQIDVEKVEHAITSKTKAILPVYWGGDSPEMPLLMQIAKKYNLHVIEDACMAPGGFIGKKRSGTFGDVSAWSMHPLKPLNVMGDGGMVSTDNPNLANWMRIYRNHGMVNRDHNDIWGVNMRLQPLQAVVASKVLKSVDQTVQLRNKLAKRLDDGLKNLPEKVMLPLRRNDCRHSFSLYMAKFLHRDKLLEHLINCGIEAKIHYKVPLHLQKAAASLGYKVGDLINSESYGKSIMTLPLHQYLNDEQIEFMIDSIKSFYVKTSS